MPLLDSRLLCRRPDRAAHRAVVERISTFDRELRQAIERTAEALASVYGNSASRSSGSAAGYGSGPAEAQGQREAEAQRQRERERKLERAIATTDGSTAATGSGDDQQRRPGAGTPSLRDTGRRSGWLPASARRDHQEPDRRKLDRVTVLPNSRTSCTTRSMPLPPPLGRCRRR